MGAAAGLVALHGARAVCRSLGLPRASYYRAQQPRSPQHTVRRPRRSPLALSVLERQDVHSAPGAGASFRVLLPPAPAARPA